MSPRVDVISFKRSAFKFLATFSLSALLATSLVASPVGVDAAKAATAAPLQNAVDYYGVFGGGDYLRAEPGKTVIPQDNFTVEAWVKPNAHSGSDGFRAAVSQNQLGGGNDVGRLFLSLVDSGGKYLVHVGLGTTSTNFNVSDGVPVGSWSHIAISYATANPTVYFNGVALGTIATTEKVGSADAPFTIGATGSDANTPATHLFTGGIDQVKVWNRALSASELQASMHTWGASTATGSGLAAHYDLNDQTAVGSVVFDRITKTTAGPHLTMTGNVGFEDVKEVREELSQQIFSFKRSYLTAVGGWQVPDGATTFSALVVGAGGGGGNDGGGGGGGGGIAEVSAGSFGAATSLGVKVGQGGLGSQNTPFRIGSAGQASQVTGVADAVLMAATGGARGHGWRSGDLDSSSNPVPAPLPAAGGTVSGSAATLVSTTGATGALGPLDCTVTDGGVGFGDPRIGGTGKYSQLTGLTFGSGGGGGIAITTTTAAIVTDNIGGPGAGRGAYVVSTGQGSGGFSGTANQGGGGGGGTACSGIRTDGGNGGSGLVVVAVNFVAKCAIGTTGFTTGQIPRVMTFPLGGLSAPRTNVVTDTTSVAAWYGKPVLLDGKIYTADRGRGQMKRVNVDGTNVELLGPLASITGLGVATDGRYVYGWGSTGIARYDTETGVYQQTFIARGVMNMRHGELAFYRHSNGVGYLFLSNGLEQSAGANQGRIFAVPVSGTSVPASITASHIFSESQLSTETTAQNAPPLGITVLNGKVYWAQQKTTSPAGNIYEKAITTDNLPGGASPTIYADRVVATALWVKTLTSDGKKLYYNDGQLGRISSFDPVAGTGAVESSVGIQSQTSGGLNVLASCALPPTNVTASLDSTGQITAGWNSQFTTGVTHRVEYRVNGGQWLSVTSTSSLTHAFKPTPTPVGLVELRVATNAFGQVSEFVNAPSLTFEAPPAPAALCVNPTKFVYEVPANTEVKLTLGQASNNTTKSIQISWGDGEVSPAQLFTGNFTFAHTYVAAGTYNVDVCGEFVSMYNIASPQTHLTAVKQWGAAESTLQTLTNAFSGAAKLTDVPATLPTNVTRTDFMFRGATIFNDPDVSGWVTTKVTNFQQMFDGASAFNQNVGAWDMSNATDIGGMFSGATAFNNGGSDSIKNWNTAKVVSMWSTFARASSFNQPIATDGSKWDVSKVRNFNFAFLGATSFNQNLSNWLTTSATNMPGMFSGATAFNNGLPAGQAGTLAWATSNVTNMSDMFSGATAFNQNVGAWNVGNVTNMGGMFVRASAFNNGGSDTIKNWVTSKVTNMGYMFNQANSFNQPITWNTSAVTSMSFMFHSAKAFNQVLDIEIDSLVDAREMLSYSGISDDNYGSIVIDFRTQHEAAGAKNAVNFGAVDKTAFCATPNAAVRYLVTTAGWTVSDKTNKTMASYCTPTVTITAKNGSHVYGDPVAAIGYTMAVSNGPIPSSDWLSEITCAPKTASNGTVLVSKQNVSNSYVTECSGPTGTGLGIAVTYVDGTYSVTKKPITVRAKNQAVFAGQATTTTPSTLNSLEVSDGAYFMVTAGSIESGDRVNFELSYTAKTGTAGVTASKYSGAGTMNIVLAAGTGNHTSNYDITVAAGELAVSSLSYIVSAKSQTKQYGDQKSFTSSDWSCVKKLTDGGGVVTQGACEANLDFTVALSSTGAAASAAVGAAAIQVSVTAAADLNATIEKVNGVLTVTKRKLTVTPDAKTVQFGSAEPSYSYSLSGFAPGESREDLPADLEITCASGYVAPTSTTLGSPRGSELPITCSGGITLQNYEIEFDSPSASKVTVPLASEVLDFVPRTLMLEPEEISTDVSFDFELTPVNQICFATLVLFDELGNSIEQDAEGNDLRVQVEANTPINFDLPLFIGSYSYELIVDGNCDIEETKGSFTIAEFTPAAVTEGVGYQGPILSEFSTKTLDACKPTKVTITGVRLSGISATVNSVAVKVLENTDTKLVIEVPAGLSPGSGVDLLVSSSFGLLTVQDAFDIPAANCVIAESKGMWTKKQNSTTVKFYSKSPIGMGKIQFFVNGREIAWLRAEDEKNAKLSFASGYPYFVRTFTLLPGKNRLEIRVDGQRVWRSTHAR